MKQKRNFPWARVTKKQEATLKTGHPWVYEDEITEQSEAIENGSLIDVFSEKGSYLGTGFYSACSRIRIRILDHNANESFSDAFFERRVRYAVQYRFDVMKEDESDPETARILNEVLQPHLYYFEEAMAEVKEDIPMRLDFESEMGDLLSDAVREEFSVDFAYFNCTSCGRFLSKGPLTRSSIAKAMGFNDYLYTSEYTGQDIYDLFEHIHYPERFGNNGNIMFSGLRVKMDHTKPAGRKVVWIRKENGEDVKPEETFTVVTSEYMSTGGNDTGDISGRVKWNNTGIRIHDTLWNYFSRFKTVEGKKDGRYFFIGTPENDNSPW